MSLRRRVVQPVARNVTISEAECVNRMLLFVDVDPVECRCLATECSEIRPFKDIFVLAYHVSVKHCHRIPPRNTLPCMMCAKNFITWETYYTHIAIKHDRIRKSHNLFRVNDPKKRGRKAKGEDRNDRSMSPTVNGRTRDEQEALAARSTRMQSACYAASIAACSTEDAAPKAPVNPLVDSNGSLLLEARNILELYEGHVRTGTKLDRAIAKLLRRSLEGDFSPSAHKRASSAQTIQANPHSDHLPKFSADDILNTKMEKNQRQDGDGADWELSGTPSTFMEHDGYASTVGETPVEPRICSTLDEVVMDTGAELGNSPSAGATANAEIPAPLQYSDVITIPDDTDVDLGSNTASETIDVVGDDGQPTNDVLSGWIEGDQNVSSDEWDGDSTKAYKSDVEDEEAVDHCSTIGTRSTPYSDSWPLECEVVDPSDGNRSPVQSFYLCGDEDISPKSLAGDNASIDNLSTTVAPKTSTSSESTADSCSSASSLRSHFSDEEEEHTADDEVAMLSSISGVASEQIVSSAGCEMFENLGNVGQENTQSCSALPNTEVIGQPYVVPTPLANFAPLSYQDYMIHPYVQEYEFSRDSDRTLAYGVAEHSMHTAGISSQNLPNLYTTQSSSLLTGQQQTPPSWTLIRPRLLGTDLAKEAPIVTRGAGAAPSTAFPNAAGFSTNPFMNYLLASQTAGPQLGSHLLEQYASNEIPVAAEQRLENDIGPAINCEVEVVAEVQDAPTAQSPRTQRSQRVRRIPMRYRDGDYVCLLSDVESGEERHKVKSGNSASTNLPLANTDGATSDGSSELQVGEQGVCNHRDLSSSHFNLSGTRWNAVFSLLEPVDSSQPKGAQYCGDCGCFCTSLETARRHVLSHIRLVRFVCKLCGVGGFFATDLRNHLMKGLCTGLYSSLHGFISVTNAMQADSLCEDADGDNPGGVILFEGERQIVSSENLNVHRPDAQVERKILQRCV